MSTRVISDQAPTSTSLAAAARAVARHGRTGLRWTVAVIVVLHGLIHLLGVVKGLGWGEVTQLTEPISTTMGLMWLAATALVVVAGAMLAVAARGWWDVGLAAAVVSQTVILSSWTDAKAGTLVNILLFIASGYGLASQGRRSLRADYRRRVAATLAHPLQTGVVTEVDLQALPGPVAAYVRQSGAVGQSRVTNFRAAIHGRIRSGPGKPWMSFTGEQVNSYGAAPSRLFFIDAALFGLPIDVLHVFVGPSATMRVRVCSLIPLVNAAGPQLDRAETVTLFNDLCVLAPAGLIGAPITWQELDEHHIRAVFTNGPHTVTANLVFNDEQELTDFDSDDRLSVSNDGKTFTPQRWSTPLRHYGAFGSRRLATYGEGHWHAPEPKGEFSYLEFHLDAITYNVDPRRGGGPA